MSRGARRSESYGMRRLRPFLLVIASAAGCSVGGLALHLSASLGGTPGTPAFEGPAQAEAAPAAETLHLETAETPGADTGIVANEAAVVATPTPTSAAAVPTAAQEAPVGALGSRLSLPAGTSEDTAKAGALLDLMNQQRLKDGLPVLRSNAALERVALARANNLVANGYFDHYSPDGESAFSELAARDIQYRLAGENLARNNYPESRTVQAAFDGLMASPGHRANILEPRFTQAGVAAVRNGKLWVYVTVFMD